MLKNIFSNWVSLFVSVILAFFVSPILVHTLGKYLYGVWTLIVSITGYFTILDFGVNTAIVRYISKYVAQKDYKEARGIYSTSFFLFTCIGVCALFFSVLFGVRFKNIFTIEHLSALYIFVSFMIVAIDLIVGLIFSVFLGTLAGLQEFQKINAVAIIVNILKNCIIVILLQSGYSLISIAVVQLAASLLRGGSYYIIIKYKYSFLFLTFHAVNRQVIKKIYNYSIYSFLIALSLKVLFYTDAVVIGSLVNVSEVTYYAIPSSLLDYIEKFVWAMIAVMIPMVSGFDALGSKDWNRNLYETYTKYIQVVYMPIIIALWCFGDDFINVWMGTEIAIHSKNVLKILLFGYGIAFSQLIAHGILKGIGKHRILSFILLFEAAANLLISILLARPFGISGVAIGTAVPLVLSTIAIIIYTCRQMNISMVKYLYSSYSGVIVASVGTVFLFRYSASQFSYAGIFLNSALCTLVFYFIITPLCLRKEFRQVLGFCLRRYNIYRGKI